MSSNSRQQQQFGFSIQIHKFVFDDKKGPSPMNGTSGASSATGGVAPQYRCQWFWCSTPQDKLGFTYPAPIPFPSVPVVEWSETPQYHTMLPMAMNSVGDRVLIIQVVELLKSNGGSTPRVGGERAKSPQMMIGDRQDTNSSFVGDLVKDASASSYTRQMSGGKGSTSSTPVERMVAHGTIDLGMFAHKPAKDYAVRLEKNFASVGKLLINLCVAPLESPLFAGKTQVNRKLMMCVERLTVRAGSATNLVPQAEYLVRIKFTSEYQKRTPTGAATNSGDNVRWNYECQMEPTRKIKFVVFQGRSVEASVTVDAARIQGSTVKSGSSGKKEFSVPMTLASTGCECALLVSSFYVDSIALDETENRHDEEDTDSRSVTPFSRSPGRQAVVPHSRSQNETVTVPPLELNGFQNSEPKPQSDSSPTGGPRGFHGNSEAIINRGQSFEFHQGKSSVESERAHGDQGKLSLKKDQHMSSASNPPPLLSLSAGEGAETASAPPVLHPAPSTEPMRGKTVEGLRLPEQHLVPRTQGTQESIHLDSERDSVSKAVNLDLQQAHSTIAEQQEEIRLLKQQLAGLTQVVQLSLLNSLSGSQLPSPRLGAPSSIHSLGSGTNGIDRSPSLPLEGRGYFPQSNFVTHDSSSSPTAHSTSHHQVAAEAVAPPARYSTAPGRQESPGRGRFAERPRSPLRSSSPNPAMNHRIPTINQHNAHADNNGNRQTHLSAPTRGPEGLNPTPRRDDTAVFQGTLHHPSAEGQPVIGQLSPNYQFPPPNTTQYGHSLAAPHRTGSGRSAGSLVDLVPVSSHETYRSSDSSKLGAGSHN